MVLQPSPFCNINCDYCYLPSRSETHRMSFDTVRRTVEEIFASDLIREQVTFVWHAGEPLAVPVSWYEQAFDVIREHAPKGLRIVHSFQSNGTLINERWCEFIKERGLCMGLSIDGPEFLHDAHRKNRRGTGTHAAAMRGAKLLQKHGIFFHVISVITREALDYPDEIFDFFVGNDIRHFGFNIEETEGEHTSSTLDGAGDERIVRFFERMFERQKAMEGAVRIREFDSALIRIRSGTRQDSGVVIENEQARPFGILSVDWKGDFSTYSPELLGLTMEPYGEFSFGSVLTDHFPAAIQSPKFQQVMRDVQAGIEECRATCSYFELCGGGAPANKYFENGSFATAATRYCRYAVKVPVDIVLADLEAAVR